MWARVHIERMPQTYPIYALKYLAEADAEPAGARAVRQSADGRPHRAVLVQQHGPLDRPGADHGRQDSAGRGAGRGRLGGPRVLERRTGAAVDAKRRGAGSADAGIERRSRATPRARAGRQALGRSRRRRALAGVRRRPRLAVRRRDSAACSTRSSYLLALVPGLPVGFALFGRRQAAGWIAGGLIGYVLTAVALWIAIAAGVPRVPGDDRRMGGGVGGDVGAVSRCCGRLRS